MYTRWTILWLCCIVSQHATAIVAAPQSRAASITLRAKWAGTSTLLEAVQFLVRKCLWSTRFLQHNTQGAAVHYISSACFSCMG